MRISLPEQLARLTLTSGIAITMTDLNGNAIATPERLTDWTFKAVWQ